MNNIRYASIRSLDVSNGENVGVSLFVQGCPFNPHCHNCFNPETWDFNGGKEWNEEVENKFLELAARPYIKRLSILGGEPLADENLDSILNLVNKIRLLFSDSKTIWLYTGNTLYFDENKNLNVMKYIKGNEKVIYPAIQSILMQDILKNVDVVVDGRYIDSQRDISLKWRGSLNQRVIDIQKSLQKGEVALWEA